jgi:NAD(P)-dependent dehydrogenase (short-subunit alcohol dehydrogenase family)
MSSYNDPEVRKGIPDLTERTALVTGGSRGLGLEISRALARAGADVVVASRKLDSCERAAALIVEETGRKIVPVACQSSVVSPQSSSGATAACSRASIDIRSTGCAPRSSRSTPRT